ncbi:MAG: hypothetical protein AMXMBFR79_16230 [Chitinophagaceae bacterium]
MFIGHSFFAFSQWIQLSVITKFCSPHDLGIYTLGLAIIGPLFIFAGLQLKAIQITDVSQNWKFHEYFTLRIIFLAAAIIFILLYSFLFSKENLTFFLLLALLKVLEGISEIMNGQQQLHEDMKKVAISNILRGFSIALGIFVGIYFLKNILFGFVIAIMCNAAVIIFYDYKNCTTLLSGKKLISFLDTRYKLLTLKAMPLAIVVTLIYLNSNVAKYFIEVVKSTVEQGIYSTIGFFIVLGNLVNNALGQAITPRLSKYFAEREMKKFNQLSKMFVIANIVLGIAIVIVVHFFGKYILTIFFNETIAQYSQLFTLFMVAGLLLYCVSCIGYILTSMHYIKQQPIIHVVGFLTNVLFCFLLVKNYGLNGAAYAWIISFLAQLVISILLLKKSYSTIANFTVK